MSEPNQPETKRPMSSVLTALHQPGTCASRRSRANRLLWTPLVKPPPAHCRPPRLAGLRRSKSRAETDPQRAGSDGKGRPGTGLELAGACEIPEGIRILPEAAQGRSHE